MTQYDKLKAKHPDAILLMRCGDFYETYHDDAETVADVLGIVLTKQQDGTRMAGFPAHALDTYLPIIVRHGHRVAICDHCATPEQPKPRAQRGRVLSMPGLTKEQYELLCECIRYRIADNEKERATALLKGLSGAWYDIMANRLKELKEIFNDITN